jgi:hypothetical protein
MYVVTRNPKYYLISLAVSIGIFLVLYFTVIKPDNNAANNAIRQGEQQVQQAVNQAAKSGGVPTAVTNYASCVTAAGTDTGKLQACATKYGK